MSGGGGAARVPIPAGKRKIIQNIKEIAGNHSEDEIYAMLEECGMDPDEAVQKLLLQDTFHVVKRKRDKRKEVPRESTDPRWGSVAQGRRGWGACGNFSSRYIADDAGTRNTNFGKENGMNQGPHKGNMSSPSITLDTENSSTSPITSSVSDLANGPTNLFNTTAQVSGNSDFASKEEISNMEISKLEDVNFTQIDLKSSGSASSHPEPGSAVFISAKPPSASGVYVSASDPVLQPSLDTSNFGEVRTIKRVIGSHRTFVEMPVNKLSAHDRPASEFSSTSAKRFSGTEVNQPSEMPQVASSYSFHGSAGSRPANYNNCSQQINGSQKVVHNKEWKPKSTHVNPVQTSATMSTFDVATTAEAIGQPLSHSMTLEETTKLEKGLDEVHLDRQHVIIPNHLQVPESERHGLSFGSFDAGFKLNADFTEGSTIDKSPPSESEICQDNTEEKVDQPSSSINITSPVAGETDSQNHPPSPTQIQENCSLRETGMSGVSTLQEYEAAKPEPVMAPDCPQHSVVQTAPYSTFGVVPQMLGSQFAPFESSEVQAHDNRVPGFVVQQPFDPSSYYTQFYRPAVDADSRFSHFLAPGSAPAKYNGSVAVLPSQTSQVPQESVNSVVLSIAGPTLTTQAAGVMQSSIAVPQQPVPLFRQAAGVHISHYPPNYIPYNQYYPPFYMSPPALHHFLGNAAFPQQPLSGSVYPPPAAAAGSTPVNYSVSQYKPGTNTGNSTLVVMPTGYGTYNSNQVGYPSSPVSEDINSSQYKDNNVYLSGQQTEGSAVWISASVRDVPSLQASSFYNIPPQGQHMTFAPTQTGHGTFSGVYHPAPTAPAAAVHPLFLRSQSPAGAVQVVTPAGAYQHLQRGQMNWSSNY